MVRVNEDVERQRKEYLRVRDEFEQYRGVMDKKLH
jgi:hypothetical protein